ncbi:MAG TPA: UDP-2,3-diacylglucosamine diphosphatase [Gemmataceae bacterium]|nr:UDP-2,3-diacylglucosamine diphosphatase [Gemmataceae bacterium]
MYDALVISDVHLGSENCQARALVQFLEEIRDGSRPTRRLVLNGDVFDSIDFRRLCKQHWKVLSLIRKLSDEVETVWVNGNHDGPAEIISHLLGVAVRDEIVVESGGRNVLLLHGHRFDEFLERYPITTRLADWGYRFLQWVDKSHYFARQAKRSSKTFLRCALKVQDKSLEYARRLGCDAVCCGHTHHPIVFTEGPVHYFNSGCWTERPCHYLTIENGMVELQSYLDSSADGVESLPSGTIGLVGSISSQVATPSP